MTIGMLALFIPWCLLTKPENENSAFHFMNAFNFTDWIICIAFGLTGVFS
jgi:hypothetical protein